MELVYKTLGTHFLHAFRNLNTPVTTNLKCQLLKQQGPGNTVRSMTLYTATGHIIILNIIHRNIFQHRLNPSSLLLGSAS